MRKVHSATLQLNILPAGPPQPHSFPLLHFSPPLLSFDLPILSYLSALSLSLAGGGGRRHDEGGGGQRRRRRRQRGLSASLADPQSAGLKRGESSGGSARGGGSDDGGREARQRWWKGLEEAEPVVGKLGGGGLRPTSAHCGGRGHNGGGRGGQRW